VGRGAARGVRYRHADENLERILELEVREGVELSRDGWCRSRGGRRPRRGGRDGTGRRRRLAGGLRVQLLPELRPLHRSHDQEEDREDDHDLLLLCLLGLGCRQPARHQLLLPVVAVSVVDVGAGGGATPYTNASRLSVAVMLPSFVDVSWI